MEYQYSTIVDSLTYDTEGLCDGIPLRVRRGQEVEDLGAIRAQEDWAKHVGPVGFVKASLGPEYNFLSVAFPEMLPGRMEVLAYFDELIFLHDDIVEAVDKTKGDEQNDEALEACRQGATGGCSVGDTVYSGRRLLVHKVSQKMLDIDRGPALAALALWTEWFADGAGRRNHSQFDSLDDYLEYRILDVGKMYLTGVLIFAMGLNMADSERELCGRLCRPAWVALGLTNDLFSFDKEVKAAKDAGEVHVCNALWVMMREHSIGDEEAKARCRQTIRGMVTQFVETVREAPTRTDLSRDGCVFLEGVQYIISGNLAWTRGAPRYNPAAVFNARQLDWMMNGTPRSLEEGDDAQRSAWGVRGAASGVWRMLRSFFRRRHNRCN